MAKKKPWQLAPTKDGLVPRSPGEPLPGETWESQEVYRKFVGNTAEELAKAEETRRAGELVDRLNDLTTDAGVQTIERNVEIANQPRDERAQQMVERYLERRTNKQLDQRERITDIGEKEIEQVVDRPLTPDKQPEKKKRLFDW